MTYRFKKRAFTLIEISIVLVIIGIILASVMKGRDMIKSSQIKEYNQIFINQWETIANSYFSRMGGVLADGTANGNPTANVNSDGFMDNIGGSTTLSTKLKEAGIDICTLIKSDITEAADIGCGANSINPYKRSVDGEFVGKSTTTLTFVKFTTTDSKEKNALQIAGIPEDVAQAIDTIRDGRPDGTSGSVLKTGSAAWDGDATGANATTTMLILLDH